MAKFKFTVELDGPFPEEITAEGFAEAIREHYCLNGAEVRAAAV